MKSTNKLHNATASRSQPGSHVLSAGSDQRRKNATCSVFRESCSCATARRLSGGLMCSVLIRCDTFSLLPFLFNLLYQSHALSLFFFCLFLYLSWLRLTALMLSRPFLPVFLHMLMWQRCHREDKKTECRCWQGRRFPITGKEAFLPPLINELM